MVLALLLSLAIGLANYFSEKISVDVSEHKPKIVSFVAGISVTYIFLHLMPGLYDNSIGTRRGLFIFVLLGFVVFHIVEKFIYKYVEDDGKVSENLKLSHSLGLLFYDFIIGILLVSLFRISETEGFLFFIPVFFHAALSNLAIHKIHGFNFRKKLVLRDKFIGSMLTMGSFYGALIATFYLFDSNFISSLTGLVAGILLYVVIREMIPKEKEGDPIWFVYGVVLYSLLIFIIWLI